MEATLVGAVVGATVQVVIQNVLSAILEINIGSDYDRELEQLNTSLVMVQKYLSDAETNNKVSGQAVKHWLNQLEDVAFEADAVLDEVKYELLRRQVKKPNGGSKKVLGFFSSGPSKFVFKLKMSGEIKDVINKLEKINKDANNLGLPMAMAVASQTSTVDLITANERETDSFSVEPFIVGRENDVLEIVEKLIASPTEETISVMPIVGMGGIGKTTIVRKVFHDEKIGNHFGKKIWVCVSFNFDSLSLLKMILEALTQELVNTTREVVLHKIKQHLEGKRYLLVLDDVWNENYGRWDEFKNTLSSISGQKGNCIVVTTRKENVASQVRTLSTHQLGGLTETQCWSIIKAKTDAPEEFECIGKRIAKRCGGLPLAAKVVGGLLRGKSEGDWCIILENKLSDDGDDKIKKILKLSYDNLPSLSLKKCFAYCSIFPQDYSIGKQEVIALWMAEGFLQNGNGDDMETSGSKVFNSLLQYSLFQDANKDIFGDVVHCKMHDLVHDLACSITKDTHQVRYLALESDDTNEPNFISQGQMKYLRTVFVRKNIANDMFSNFKRLHVLKLWSLEIEELPFLIERLIHLRSLDISFTLVEWLPDSVGNLYHLQTLSTPIESLKKLPNTTINLVSLRHLHISTDTELPPEVGKLTSLRTLRHFKVRDEDGYGIGELGKLKNLRGELQIENLDMVRDKEEAELADLYGKLGIFKLVLKWNESRDDVGHDENVLDGLQPHPHLKSLKIIGYKGKNLPSWAIRMAAQNTIGGSWEAFNSLVEIKLSGCKQCEELPSLGHLRRLKFLNLKDLPNVLSIGISFYGLENCSTPKTAFLALESFKLWSMPELTEWLDVEGASTVFPCLKHLEIIECPKLKNVHCHFPSCLENIEVYGADFSLTNSFSSTSSLQNIDIRSMPGLESLPSELFMKNQNLTNLKIFECPELKRIVPRSLHGGASLKELSVGCCWNLEELADDLSTLCNLEELTIYSCGRLKCIPYDARGQSQGLTSLRVLRISGCKELMDLPIELLESCTSSLESLHLYDLESLENLDTLIPFIGRMSRLKELTIYSCGRLKCIPYDARGQSQGLTSLRVLRISGCKELMDLPIELLESCTSSLGSLHLYDLESLENLDTLIPCIGRMSRLQELGLFGIPKLMIFPTEICSLRSLQMLTIGDFSESMNAASFNDGLTTILHNNCSSLISLILYGKEHWESLPDSIQHLTNLKELDLFDFGIEDIPEWIGNLSSLQILWILDCKRLCHLPSKEAMKRLTKLDDLNIQNCPLLKERCSPPNIHDGQHGSEWPKISHIRRVKIDDEYLPTK